VRLFRRRRKVRQVALGPPAAMEDSWRASRALPPDVTPQLARFANLKGMG
jgi:hypothetical protein